MVPDTIRYYNYMNTQHVHRHGGPKDRGAADWWYQRVPVPNMYDGLKWDSLHIYVDHMTPEQIQEYWDGYNEAKLNGDHKWGRG